MVEGAFFFVRGLTYWQTLGASPVADSAGGLMNLSRRGHGFFVYAKEG